MENVLGWYNQQLEAVKFYRLVVMAFILMVQVNIIVPITMLAITMNSGNVFEIMTCAALSFAILVSLIGGASVKTTVPLFAVSTVVHLSIILVNVI